MRRASRRLISLAGLLAVLQTPISHGEIVIDRTRVIYPAEAREVTVNLTNETDGPRLVQAWIDAADSEASPENSDVPFTLTQPIFRMEAGSARALRILHHSAARPREKQESVYWLNVLAIRPTAEPYAQENQVHLAFRTRIKLFLRPEGLPGRAQDAGEALQWQLVSAEASVLHVSNPSAYHVTLSSVTLILNGVEYPSDDPPMIAPQAQMVVGLPRLPADRGSDAALRFTTLDDQGSTQVHAAQLGRTQ